MALGAFRIVEVSALWRGLWVSHGAHGTGVGMRFERVLEHEIRLADRHVALIVGRAIESELRCRMAEGNVVTPAECATWFGPKLPRPEEPDLVILAEGLNIIRVTRPREDAFAVPRQHTAAGIAKTLKGLRELKDAHLAAIDLAVNAIDPANAPENSEALRRAGGVKVAMIDELGATLERAARWLHHEPRKSPSFYYGDAIWLAAFLRGLAERQGQDVSFSVSGTDKPGPGSNFIVTAMARATAASRVTAASVVRALKRFELPPDLDEALEQ